MKKPPQTALGQAFSAWVFTAMAFPALALEGLPPTNPQGIPSDGRVIVFRFAAPDFPAVISLGVYDSKKRLVRRLAEALPEKNFALGLNGFEHFWDGRDDVGKEVKPGQYEIHGYAVGWSGPEGVSFHGNTWVERYGESLPVCEVLGFEPVRDGGVLLLFRQDDGLCALAHISNGREIVWSRPLEEAPSHEPWDLRAVSEKFALLTHGKELVLVDLVTGHWQARAPLEVDGLLAAALDGEAAVLLTRTKRICINVLGLSEISCDNLPATFVRAAISPNGRIIAAEAEDGRYWVGRTNSNVGELHWKKTSEEAFPFHILGICPAGPDRFWFVFRVETDPDPRVGEFSAEGEFLREIKAGTFPGAPEKLRISRGESEIVVQSRKGNRVFLTGLRQTEREGVNRWEVAWRECIDLDATIPAEGFRSLPCRIKVQAFNPLSGKRETSTLRLVARSPNQVEIQSLDGLNLLRAMRSSHFTGVWGRITDGTEPRLEIWVKTRGWAEVFALGNLSAIAYLDVGFFEWPPSPTAAPEEKP
jgi:hypothetical protein